MLLEKGPVAVSLSRADLIAVAAMMPSPPPQQRRRTIVDNDGERSLDGRSLGWIEMPLPISSELCSLLWAKSTTSLFFL